MRYGEADVDFYKLLGIDKSANRDTINSAADSKITEWSQRRGSQAYDEYCSAIRDRCALARKVLLNTSHRSEYDTWLSKSDDAGKRCVQLLSAGVYEDAARFADDVVGRQDNIDKEWVGVGQWCLAAEAYYRAGDEKKFGEAQSAAGKRPLHHPAILELKGDFLLSRVLFEAKKDISKAIGSKDYACDVNLLKDEFERICGNFEKARKAYEKMMYKEMMEGEEVLSRDEYGIDLDNVKVVSESKQRICEVYSIFIKKFLGVIEDNLDERSLAFAKAIDLIKVEIPKDLPLGGLLQGYELPSRLVSIEDFYRVCRDVCNDLNMSYRERLESAREKAIRAIIRLRILLIIEPIALGVMSFMLVLFFTHHVKDDLTRPMDIIFSLSFATLLAAAASWAYAHLINVQNLRLEGAMCNVALKDEPCDADGRVRSNIWENLRIEHKLSSSSISIYMKLGIVFLCLSSVGVALLGLA